MKHSIGKSFATLALLVVIGAAAVGGYFVLAPSLRAKPQLQAHATQTRHHHLRQRHAPKLHAQRLHPQQAAVPKLAPVQVAPATTRTVTSTTAAGSSNGSFYATKQLRHDQQIARQAEKHNTTGGFYATKTLNREKQAGK